jgi:hypothetical protein
MGTLSGTVEDRAELRDLYARYCQMIDHSRYEEWLDCFTDDGVFESPRFGRHAGRDDLKKFTALYRESLGGARVIHLAHNILMKIEGERASGYCDFSYFHCKDARIQQETVGFYTDVMRKTPAGWRFLSRCVTILGSR